MVYKANELRNQIAHTFDQAKIKKKMEALRAAYLESLSEAQRKGVRELDDTRIAAGACELCRAYLVVATDAVKAGKKL